MSGAGGLDGSAQQQHETGREGRLTTAASAAGWVPGEGEAGGVLLAPNVKAPHSHRQRIGNPLCIMHKCLQMQGIAMMAQRQVQRRCSESRAEWWLGIGQRHGHTGEGTTPRGLLH